MPGQRKREDAAQGVALVVVKKEISLFGWREVRQPSRNRTACFGILTRIYQVCLSKMQEPRGAQGNFPSPDASQLNGQGKKDIGIAKRIMIEKIAGPGTKIRQIQGPPAKGYGDAELALFVALSM